LSFGNRVLVSKQNIRLPSGTEINDYLRIRTPPFVTILALTEQGEVICERQYKHGVGRTILTLVSGGIDDNEEPEKAARRELLEETGYISDNWRLLAETVTHANAGGSRFYSFIVKNCRKVAEPNSGDLETIQVELLSFEKVLLSVVSGDSPLAADATTLLHGLLALKAGGQQNAAAELW
jgi:ADP-ribose pyrophosphatase